MKKTTLKAKLGLILAGIFVGLIVLEILLRLGGYVISVPQKMHNDITGNAVAEGNRTYVILALGESTTAGGSDSWPAQLEEILNNKSKTRFRVFNEGLAGTNTAFILQRCEGNIQKYHPDMVISMMGVNDDWLTFKYEDSANTNLRMIWEELRVYKLGDWILSALKNRAKKPIQQPTSQNSKSCQEAMSIGAKEYNNGSFSLAKQHLKQAIQECHPDDLYTYLWLSMIYDMTGEREEAIKLFREDIAFHPDFFAPYAMLAHLIKDTSENESVAMNLKVIELNPYYYGAYLELVNYYAAHGNKDAAAETIRKFLELNKTTDGVQDYPFTEFGKMQYEKQLNDDAITEYYTKAGFTFAERDTSPRNITAYHYQMLYSILKRHGIKYLAMQYPTLDVQMLKSMLPGRDDVIFVSNKENFEQALKMQPYGYWFVDNLGPNREVFHGDFGHATQEGNRLIAENLATIILEWPNQTAS
jgi:tetratricopeptide (TPR) repeat protein